MKKVKKGDRLLFLYERKKGIEKMGTDPFFQDKAACSSFFSGSVFRSERIEKVACPLF